MPTFGKALKKGKLVPSYLLGFLLSLAAISSSRSDVVTQCVRVFVRPSPFFSFSVLEESSCPKEFQWCLKVVSIVFEV